MTKELELELQCRKMEKNLTFESILLNSTMSSVSI